MVKHFSFQTIQLSISPLFALSLNVKEFYLTHRYDSIRLEHIPKNSNITGVSPSDCLVSYTWKSLVGVLPFCKNAVGVFYSPAADWAPK